jgi:asparagine synthase (glutamine-hydrolysing)
MCGIAGFFDRRRPYNRDRLVEVTTAMTESLAHRGPDGQDIWVDPEAGIGFGHRRLAIVDLSPTGKQPMRSASGRYVATYNGEIYNYLELRAELEQAGTSWRGTSDTEVMLAGFEHWGVQSTLARMVGMFAIALWDTKTRDIWLIRDRLGVKPLYYTYSGNCLAFGSELKALRTIPDRRWTLNRSALAGYMRFGYVPAPATIYGEARKLPAGHYMRWQPGKTPTIESYWSARDVAMRGRAQWAHPADARESTDRLEALLKDAVAKRMIADVPLGAFLSGGIDSSLVVALMQAQSAKPVRSFTIGFSESGYDEARHAKAVAAHLGTDHTELYVEPRDALNLIPNLSRWYDEPFSDSSQIPTYLVSEMTRRHVTVALSGDGGDEHFAGYNRYVWAAELWRRIVRTPGPIRALGAAALGAMPRGAFDLAARFLPQRYRPARPAEKAAKLAEILRMTSGDAIYRRLVSQWQEPDAIVCDAHEPNTPLTDATLLSDMPDFVARMQLVDTLTYLPDDILTKVDRATMAVGLEGRAPLLDHRVVEYAWTLPLSLKLRGGEGKWILREILARYVPRNLFERPKMGFGVPIDSWLRGPLRDWADDLLDPKAIAADGLLDPTPIAEAWELHRSGKRDMHYPLWTILMFRDWQRAWG